MTETKPKKWSPESEVERDLREGRDCTPLEDAFAFLVVIVIPLLLIVAFGLAIWVWFK